MGLAKGSCEDLVTVRVAVPGELKLLYFESPALILRLGAGDFYCSGNDLSNFMGIDPSNMKAHAVDGAVVLK